jgi:hypothetical protein
VEWHLAGKIITGHMASYQIGPDKMRRFGNGHTLSFTVEPPQACYEAANVTNGVTRPAGYTNLWKSDPAKAFPQGLVLEWKDTQHINQVELTFPGHLIRELHAYAPFYRDPQCPKDYSIDLWINGKWDTIQQVRDNYQRHRKHRLPTEIETKRLRINIHSTNGDPSAQLYEVRCYREA